MMLLIQTQVFAVVVIVFFACGKSETSEIDKKAQIIFSEDDRDYQLNYKYKFDTTNGISRAETGDFEAKTVDTKYADIKGYYSYVAPDGIRYTVTYIADQNGFQPKIHKSSANQLPAAAYSAASRIVIDGIDDERIGTKLLLSLGGGGLG